MKPEIIAIMVIFVVFSAAEFVRTGFFKKKGQRRKDGIVEAISTTVLVAVTQPLVLLGGGLVAAAIFPDKAGVLATWSIAAQVGLLLFFDDMTQYWWHRLNHNVKWLSPLMWVVERVISTPATHSAHHGRYKDDGVTHYKGNYGNLLFFWDILFGTARITRRYPEKFGVENLDPVTAPRQLLWPIIRDKKQQSTTQFQ